MDELPIEVEALDKVPGEFRHLYENLDGKYKIAEPHVQVANAVNGLNKSLRAAREENKKNKPVDLSPLSDFGATPAEIRANIQTKLQELQDTIAKTPDQKLALDNLRADMLKAFDGEKKPLVQKTEAYRNQLYTLLVDNQATTAVVENKGVPKLLLPFVKQHVKVVEENGEFNVCVVDAQGERRYSGVNGSPMTIKDLVAEMKTNPEYSRLFDSEAPVGGGGKDPRSGSRLPSPSSAPRSANQKIAAGLAKSFSPRRS